MQALNSAAEAAGALICDINTQINFVTDKIKDLQSAVLLGSAPQGGTDLRRTPSAQQHP